MKIKGLDDRVIKIYRKKLWENPHYYQIVFGGASAAKSYSVFQLKVLKCLLGANILVMRKVGSTIKRSVFNEIVGKIYDFKLQDFFRINKSDFEITCTLNDKQILFAGADDPEKLKSIRPLNGPIDEIVLEEATEFTYKDFKTIKKRMRGISKFKKCITLIFNPILQEHWIFKEFFHIWQDTDDKLRYFENNTISILKTTYLDNPFLADEDIDALENESDPYFKDVYTYGNWGVLGETIFRNYKSLDFDCSKFDRVVAGIDWGFACLSGDSIVSTDKGGIPIKNIKVGDSVLTRDGYKKVTMFKNNGYKDVFVIDFGYRNSIIATADHKIYTKDGWKRVDELNKVETICVKQLSLMGKFIKGILKASTPITFIIKQIIKAISCIGIFGNSITEKSKKVMLSIIKIATLLIIILITLFVLPLVNIVRFIIMINLGLSQKKNQKEHEKRTDIQKIIGKKEGKSPWQPLKAEEVIVKSVEKLSKYLMFIRNTVVRIVERKLIPGQVKKNMYAKFVAINSWLHRITSEKLVHKSVHINLHKIKDKIEVFDISVENHEFVANGILVHNCDPFAFNKVYYDKKKSELYIWGEVHEVGATDKSMMEMLKYEKQTYITADSSEPKTIDLWNSEGFFIEPAKKGAGSIESGIKFLQSLTIYIHTDSPKTLLEFQTYQWQVDKDGNVKKRPVDKNNHHIDAIRYAIENEIVDNSPRILDL